MMFAIIHLLDDRQNGWTTPAGTKREARNWRNFAPTTAPGKMEVDGGRGLGFRGLGI